MNIQPNEYNPYYRPYISLAGDRDLISMLEEGAQATRHFFVTLPEEKHSFCYTAGKWTPKEILLHLIDTERVFAYRALHFSRSKNVVLPGFDQDEFVAQSFANNRSIPSLLEEYTTVRNATVALFTSFTDQALLALGEASGSAMSVRAAGIILCGHEKHHIQVIKDKYL